MLKNYLVDGKQYQYEEGEQPEGAVEVEEKNVEQVKTKIYKPANKARRTAKK